MTLSYYICSCAAIVNILRDLYLLFTLLLRFIFELINFKLLPRLKHRRESKNALSASPAWREKDADDDQSARVHTPYTKIKMGTKLTLKTNQLKVLNVC